MNDIKTVNGTSHMTSSIYFTIPTKHLKRATVFYKELLQEEITIKINAYNNTAMIVDNITKINVGYLYEEKIFIPDMFGTIIYFELIGPLKERLVKVEQLGGKVVSITKTDDLLGYNALIHDSEGNRIGLFLRNAK